MIKKVVIRREPIRTRPFPTTENSSGRDLGKEEKRLLAEVIDSGRLNRVVGSKVCQLEKEFTQKYGVTHAIASTSGTAAIHIALSALGLNPGDEVITSPISDIGTVIPILLCNCIPIFADVDPLTNNLLAEEVKKRVTSKTKAIIVPHLFGQPADLDPILEMAGSCNLYLIEDCCQAHLAEYKGKKVGTMGDLGCFSFQQSKQMTTGDGGMTITNNDQLADKARLVADKAWPRRKGRVHPFLGFNYRMTELQGAVGLAQLAKLESIVQRRRKMARFLTNRIKEILGIIPPKIIPGVLHSWWVYPFSIDSGLLNVSPSDFGKTLNAEGVPVRLGFIPNPLFEYGVIRERRAYGTSRCPWSCPRARKNIQYRKAEYPCTKKALEELLLINWNEGISKKDVLDIARGIERVANFYRRKVRRNKA